MSDFDRNVGMLLSAYLDDELTAEERARLEQQLQTDNRLQAELEELQQTVTLLRQMPILKAPRNYTLNPAEFQQPRRVIYPWRAVMAAAAVMVLVFGAVFFLLRFQEGEETSQESLSDVAVVPTSTGIVTSIPSEIAAMPTFAFTATPLSTDMFRTAVTDEIPEDEMQDAAGGAVNPAAVEPTATIDLLSIPSGTGAGEIGTTLLPFPTPTAMTQALAPDTAMKATVELHEESDDTAFEAAPTAMTFGEPGGADSEAGDEDTYAAEIAPPGIAQEESAANQAGQVAERRIMTDLQILFQQLIRRILQFLLP